MMRTKNKPPHKLSILRKPILSKDVKSLVLRLGVSIMFGMKLFLHTPEQKVIEINLESLQNRPHIQEKVRPIISSEEIRLKHIIADNVVNLEFVNYETLINKSAREYDIDPSIIFAQIHKESGYNPTALDYNNALGLMQVTPIAFKEMKRLYERKFFLMEQLKDKSLSDSIRKKYEWEFKQIRHIHSLPDKHSDLRDPSLNIGVGMQVLKYYIERRKALGSENSLIEGLAEYNAGPDNINAISLDYATRILRLSKSYQKVIKQMESD